MRQRIIIICKGQTEQEFCRKLLTPYFYARDIDIQCPLIKISKGGIVKWDVLKDQVEKHLKEDGVAMVTTLIDYYGIEARHGFPRWEEGENIGDKNQRMTFLEEAMKAEIESDLNWRFIPYIQLHEFEGLLFNRIEVFESQFTPEEIVCKEELIQTFNDFDNPEMINSGRTTSPGHRLKRIIKGYNKVVYGICLAEAIGIDNMKNKSPRFRQWIEQLIGKSPNRMP